VRLKSLARALTLIRQNYRHGDIALWLRGLHRRPFRGWPAADPPHLRKATSGGFSAEVSAARQLAMGTPPIPGTSPKGNVAMSLDLGSCYPLLPD